MAKTPNSFGIEVMTGIRALSEKMRLSSPFKFEIHLHSRDFYKLGQFLIESSGVYDQLDDSIDHFEFEGVMIRRMKSPVTAFKLVEGQIEVPSGWTPQQLVRVEVDHIG